MKLLWAILFYVAMAAVLAYGIILVVRGSLWLLILGIIGYSLALGLIGCLPKKAPH
jgi:hypothetical protein